MLDGPAVEHLCEQLLQAVIYSLYQTNCKSHVYASRHHLTVGESWDHRCPHCRPNLLETNSHCQSPCISFPRMHVQKCT